MDVGHARTVINKNEWQKFLKDETMNLIYPNNWLLKQYEAPIWWRFFCAHTYHLMGHKGNFSLSLISIGFHGSNIIVTVQILNIVNMKFYSALMYKNELSALLYL